MTMLDKSEWAGLIPHTGTMCLLDAVVAWDETIIHAISTSHARADHPLRSAAGLHAVHLAEYGAQAMAVHGALLARAQGASKKQSGRLVSLRNVVLNVEYVDEDNGRLDVHVESLYADSSGAQCAFRIEQGGQLLVSGRAAVIHFNGTQRDA